MVDAGRWSLPTGCPPARVIVGDVAAVGVATAQKKQLCLDVDIDVEMRPRKREPQGRSSCSSEAAGR